MAKMKKMLAAALAASMVMVLTAWIYSWCRSIPADRNKGT